MSIRKFFAIKFFKYLIRRYFALRRKFFFFKYKTLKIKNLLKESLNFIFHFRISFNK